MQRKTPSLSAILQKHHGIERSISIGATKPNTQKE